MNIIIFILKPLESLTPDQLKKTIRLYGVLTNDSDHLLENFLNLYMPGFKITDPLEEISTLLSARNPG